MGTCLVPSFCYQQALTIFRKNGSEAGRASVLNNLAVVYEQEGDPATAEKLYRQAKLVFGSSMTKRAGTSLLGILPINEWRRGI